MMSENMRKSTDGETAPRTTDAYRRLIFLAILTGALFIRLLTISSQSLWGDEAFSLNLALHNPGTIIETIRSGDLVEVHPPLYYILLHYCIRIFGDDLWALRILSAAASVLLLIPMYFFANRCFGRKAAEWAILLAACSTILIWYGQETRMYALLSLCVMTTVFLLGASLNGKPLLVYAAWFSILIAAYTHYYAFLIVAAIDLWFLYELLKRRLRRNFIASFLFGHIIFCVLYSPWAPTLWAQFRFAGEHPGFTHPFSPILSVPYLAVKLLFFGTGDFYREKLRLVLFGILAFMLALLLIKNLIENRKRRHSEIAQLLTAVSILPIAIAYCANLLGYDLFRTYPFVMLTPLWLTAIAGIACRPGRKWGIEAVAAVLLVGNLISYAAFIFPGVYGKEDIRTCTETVVSRFQPGDLVGKIPEMLPGKEEFNYLAWKYHAGERLSIERFSGATPREVVDAIKQKARTTDADAPRSRVVWIILPKTFPPSAGEEISDFIQFEADDLSVFTFPRWQGEIHRCRFAYKPQ